MIELKDNFIIRVDKKNNTKRVKGFSFFSNPLNRKLFIHADIDDNNKCCVSDVNTGYRFFTIPQKVNSVKLELINEKLDNFIRHYSIPEIQKEIDRVERLLLETSQK